MPKQTELMGLEGGPSPPPQGRRVHCPSGLVATDQ
jgi:hypothetical protein